MHDGEPVAVGPALTVLLVHDQLWVASPSDFHIPMERNSRVSFASRSQRLPATITFTRHCMLTGDPKYGFGCLFECQIFSYFFFDYEQIKYRIYYVNS